MSTPEPPPHAETLEKLAKRFEGEALFSVGWPQLQQEATERNAACLAGAEALRRAQETDAPETLVELIQRWQHWLGVYGGTNDPDEMAAAQEQIWQAEASMTSWKPEPMSDPAPPPGQCRVGELMADDYFQHAAECPECEAYEVARVDTIRRASLRAQPPEGLVETVRKLIADDAWAITFQSLGQYRTALLRALSAAIAPPPAYTVCQCPCGRSRRAERRPSRRATAVAITGTAMTSASPLTLEGGTKP